MSIDNSVQSVGFPSATLTCEESCEKITVEVIRTGPLIDKTEMTLNYTTVPGSAKPNVNYVPVEGTLTFPVGEIKQEIEVKILDDGVFEEFSKFFGLVALEPTLKYCGDMVHCGAKLAIGTTKISILDVDHCGIFSFDRPEMAIADNIGVARLKVIRQIGTKGKVVVPYRITSGTAKSNYDFKAPQKGTLFFNENRMERFIDVKIVDRNRHGQIHTFYVELLQPRKESSKDLSNHIGNPTIGEPKIIQIGICEDEEQEQSLERLLKMTDLAEYFIKEGWVDQLKTATTVIHEPQDSKCKKASSYVVFILALPWRLIAALVPPARYLHGWLAYITLLCAMAIVAALVGDTATYLGCAIGLKDTVTAITIVPVGMGLPDLFASRQAAISEPTADAAIGQITGSNAVNVFLGMGLTWTIASAVQTYKTGKGLRVSCDFVTS